MSIEAGTTVTQRSSDITAITKPDRPRAREGAAVRVVGVDAWTGGWIAVALADGQFEGAWVGGTVGQILAAWPDAVVVGIDIPIGFPETRDRRPADLAAAAFVGPRRSSVFPTPPRAVVETSGYGEANVRCRALTGRGLSRQSFALFPRILEVDRHVAADGRLHEVHPEASFRRLAGAALRWSKRSWGGVVERRALLAAAGVVPPDDLGPAAGVPVDDVLDAAVAAWSADRIARGVACPLPDRPPCDHRGRAVAIWT